MSFSWPPHIAKKKVRRYLRVSLFATTFGFPKWQKCFHASLIFFWELCGRGGISQLGQTDGDTVSQINIDTVQLTDWRFFFSGRQNLKTLPGSFFPFFCFSIFPPGGESFLDWKIKEEKLLFFSFCTLQGKLRHLKFVTRQKKKRKEKGLPYLSPAFFFFNPPPPNGKTVVFKNWELQNEDEPNCYTSFQTLTKKKR